jgi:hypothetical protein
MVLHSDSPSFLKQVGGVGDRTLDRHGDKNAVSELERNDGVTGFMDCCASTHFRRYGNKRRQPGSKVIQDKFPPFAACSPPALPHQLFKRRAVPVIRPRHDAGKIGVCELPLQVPS